MMVKIRTKIPENTAAEVVFRAHRQCCVCKKRGDHIHHIDGDPSNNDINNLVLLCFDDHNEATIKQSLRRTLTPAIILKYREQHHKAIEAERKITIDSIDAPLTKSSLTEEKLLEISKNAIIILELEKIKERYYKSDWTEKSEILQELQKYSNHRNNRLTLEIFEFLSGAANHARAGMTESVALGIFSLVMDFAPSFRGISKRKEIIEIGRLGVEIGHSIVYDSFIYLKKLSVARWGLTIVKFIYKLATENKITALQEAVKAFYVEAFSNLKRPERNDLEDSKRLLEVFYQSLDDRNLSFPPTSNDLWQMMEEEVKNERAAQPKPL